MEYSCSWQQRQLWLELLTDRPVVKKESGIWEFNAIFSESFPSSPPASRSGTVPRSSQWFQSCSSQAPYHPSPAHSGCSGPVSLSGVQSVYERKALRGQTAYLIHMENQIQFANIFKTLVQRLDKHLSGGRILDSRPKNRCRTLFALRTWIRSKIPNSLSDESTQKTKYNVA